MTEQESLNEVRIIELEKRMSLQMEATDKAVQLAANELRVRLEAMNEFRAAMKDQTMTFAARREVENQFERVYRELKALDLFRVSLEAKASQLSVTLLFVFSVFGFLLSLYRAWH